MLAVCIGCMLIGLQFTFFTELAIIIVCVASFREALYARVCVNKIKFLFQFPSPIPLGGAGRWALIRSAVFLRRLRSLWSTVGMALLGRLAGAGRTVKWLARGFSASTAAHSQVAVVGYVHSSEQ